MNTKKETLGTENIVLYIAIVAAVLVLGWVLWSSYAGTGTVPAANTYSSPASGSDDCGDLSDSSNVQHLSHHPSQYAECIKKVDPAVFKQAVGKDKDAFLSENGLE